LQLQSSEGKKTNPEAPFRAAGLETTNGWSQGKNNERIILCQQNQNPEIKQDPGLFCVENTSGFSLLSTSAEGASQCSLGCFSPKRPLLLCILHGKFREVAWTRQKNRKQAGAVKLILALLWTGSGITLLAQAYLGLQSAV